MMTEPGILFPTNASMVITMVSDMINLKALDEFQHIMKDKVGDKFDFILS
jgi:hypothetical protein